MSETKRGKFFKGALILMLFGLLSKIVGAIYRIPLTSIITAEGMGLYQMVFPLYTLLLTISSSSIPSSISKLISESVAQNNFKQADRILKVSFILLLSMSILCSLVVLVGARFFAKVQGNANAYICYYGLCPAIIFVGLISGFRGYFQGFQCMTPSAISGFIEQVIKLGFGLWLASILKPKGISYCVLGALFAISISEVFAFIYLLIRYFFSRKRFRRGEQVGELLTYRKTAKQILSLSVFVTLGGLIMPLTMLLDSSITINILKSIGYSVKSATTLFGLQSGSVGSIVNMPVVLSLSIATAVLPCLSHQIAQKDMAGAIKSSSKALSITLILSLPASVGCYALAEPILKLLYFKSLSPNEIAVAVQILKTASLSIFYLAMLQVSSGILQGAGCFCVPVISLAVGGAVKVILNLVLIRIASINILGAEVANCLCYCVALLINLVWLRKKGLLNMSKKILAVAFLSALIVFAKPLFEFLHANMNYVLSFAVTIFMVICVYFVAIFLLFRPHFAKKRRQ